MNPEDRAALADMRLKRMVAMAVMGIYLGDDDRLYSAHEIPPRHADLTAEPLDQQHEPRRAK